MIDIRAMTAADLPLGLRLKDQAGWNQTESDWRRVLDLQPDGCFVAQLDGRPVGTTATSIFESIGWVSMVLVEDSVRRCGIGTRLMEYALAYLDARGIRTIRLDATPLGRPLYEKLGFVLEYDLARWEGTAACGERPAGVCPAAAEHLDAICALDRQATGTNRRQLLERLFQERPDAMHVFMVDRQVAGYRSLRFGSRAVQIGPVAALNAIAGRALADAAMFDCAARPVFIDIPQQNAAATEWAASKGLRVQRLLTRMRRGPPVHDRPEQLWGSFGPEKG